MAGLTKDGYVIKRFDEILEELNTNLSSNLGLNIDTSVNSVAGIQNSLIAKQLASLWELGQNVYDGGDLLKAEGQQLDNVALLQGLLRLSPTPTRGIAWFSGDNGVQLTSANRISSLAGGIFLPENDFTIDSTSSIEGTMTVSLANDFQAYQITIDSVIYTYTSSANATFETIRDGLFLELTGVSGVFSVTKVGTDSMRFVATDKTIPLSVSGTSYITFSDIITPSTIVSEANGFISGDAFAITRILSPVNGWASVVNPTDLNLGRNQETDTAFRTRILETFSTIGSGTPDTIIQRIIALPNVQSAILYENDKWAIDTGIVPNLPPKSFTCTVHDGDTQDIADTIWGAKPAGIQTVGNTSVLVTDPYGQTHTVSFSRPQTKYAWVKIYYTKYNEEIFPSDGEYKMKQTSLEFGDTLAINEDIIPRRFAGNIYLGITGLDVVDVQIAITSDPTISDPDDASLVYTGEKIAISPAEVSSFGLARMNTYLNVPAP